jgi:hypothetical protein
MGWTKQETPTEVRLIKPGAGMDSGIVGEVLGSDEPATEDASEPFFSLKYQLRDFLASNLATLVINGRHLRLYVDPAGREGVEFPSGVGPIDILAVGDRDSN